MVAVQFGVAQAAAITVGGPTQTFTASGMTEVPKFAIGWVTIATVNGTAVNGALLCVGITDGTNSRNSNATHENTGGNSNTKRRGSTALFQVVNLNTGAVVSKATFVSFAAGQITIQWDTTGGLVLPAAAYQIGFLLGGGTSVTAKVGSSVFTATVLNTATIVNTSPVIPEDVFFLQDRTNFVDTSTVAARTSLGIASCDYSTSPSTVQQICISMAEASGVAAADPVIRTQPSFVAGRVAKTVNSAGDGPGYDFIGADAVGGGRFVIRSRDVTGTNEGCGWLAINYGGTGPGVAGVVKHGVFYDVSPLATGNTSHVTGFRPQMGLVLSCRTSAVATNDVSSTAGGIGIGACSSAASAAAGISTRDAGVALTRSVCHARVIEVPADGGGVGLRAAFNAFNASDLSLNYQNVLANQAVVGLWAVGEPFVAAALPVVPLVLSTNAPVGKVNQSSTLPPVPIVLSTNAPTATVVSVGGIAATLPVVPLVLFAGAPAANLGISIPARPRASLRFPGPRSGTLKVAGVVKGRLTNPQP